MKKFVLIDSTPLPDEGAKLCLFEYGEDFIIKREDGKGGQLMNTRMHGSEDALGRLACTQIASRANPRVLIGGLGMGFTLAAALAQLGDQAQVLVAELLEGVIRWNQGPLGAKAGYPAKDPRAQILHEDVARILKTDTQGFDAIMLDVDNGPEGLTQSINSWLYSIDGLRGCKQALRPGGVLAVWSASIDQRFSARLRSAGFRTEEVQVYAHGNRGPKHTIWLAK
ncbi:spermidine synthase [Halopseudomonas pelagia]|uniref:spermidine synthase n=1 Tax=Halopseudomonas pelagia TaxID=553151 RepID=UPI0003A57E8E|nr:spermidine synthase [Halopseudomonas pelagia]